MRFGCKKRDVIGKSLLELTPEKHWPMISEHLEDLVKGKSTQGEVELQTKKGTVMAEFKSSPIKKSGKIVGFQIILIDITERKRLEEKLKESEERFRDLFEGIQDPVGIFVGREGLLIDYNQAFKELSGYTDEELKDKTFLEFIHPDDCAMVLEKYQTEYSEEELPLVYEIRGTNKKGEAIPLELSVGTYKKKGRVIGIEVVHRNITQRKRLEEELREFGERLRDLYESVPDALAVYVGREGHLMECNKSFKKWAGYTDEDLKDKVFLDFVHPDDRALVMERYRTDYSEDQFPVIYEIRTVNKKGESHPTEISVGPYRKKGRIIGINVMHRDITERTSMREKLEEYSQQLEILVEKRTSQLKEAQEQLIKSERLAAVGQAAAIVGHDLRNPLTGINSAAYYLKMKLGPRMSKKTKEMLELIEKDVLYSNNIITDLMEYSREIRLELTETTPKSIMRDSLSLVEIPQKIQVQDSTQDEPRIKIDIEKTKRVFSNFINNAVDAMPEGGKLAISSKESDGNVEVIIVDTGIGMAKEVMEKLWTPFFTTKAKGMGLGLAICKRIIEAHGGRISVESIVGEGTTFRVTIPMEPKPIEKGGKNVWVNVPESLLSTTTKP